MMWVVLRQIGIFVATLVVAAALVFFLAGPLPEGAGGPLGWLAWMGHGLTGDFGVSIARAAPAGALVLQSLAVTLPLFILALLVAALIGVAFAAYFVRWPGAETTTIGLGKARTLAVVPPFWLGLLLVLVFAGLLRWLPPGGFFAWTDNFGGALAALVLPVLALAIPFGAALGVDARRIVIGELEAPWLVRLRDRGTPVRAVFWPHVARNIAVRLLPRLRVLLPALLAATWIVETAFYLPGLGRLIVDGVIARDPMLTRAALFSGALLASLLVLLADLTLAWADPRLRAGEAA